ncbi:MAG: histidine triad nucleotide-binding protein [Treponema sp.]|nr:histidine triad nucleotide-binding protein [Treponema sp.]
MDNCIFCKIIKGEIPSKKIYEDEDVLAFYDAAPQSPIHFLVIPKRHIKNIMELELSDQNLAGNLLVRAQKLSIELGCGEKGARFVINCKEYGGQTVDHLHVHVLGGRSFGWPPG